MNYFKSTWSQWKRRRAQVKINYVLPFTGLTGGVKVIFEHVNRLCELGHEATVIVPREALPVTWFDIKSILGISDMKMMPDADIVVATASQSALLVANLLPSKGTKFYFVQGYETLWCGDVDFTYILPMKKIVVSSWLQEVMKEGFGQDSVIVSAAIESFFFKPRPEKTEKTNRILVLNHVFPYLKGTWIAVEAFKLAKKRLPQLELVMFGTLPNSKNWPCHEYHQSIREEALADLYASCDLFVFPCIAEGCPLPPLEAMASGTAVVTTAHSGTRDYADLETAFIVPPHDIEATAEAITQAISDDGKRLQIAKAGQQKSADFSWEKIMPKLEKVYLSALKPTS